MPYDKPLIAHKLQRWDQYITDYHLPQWDSIPDFGLYMDQVILLLERYLSFIPPVSKLPIEITAPVPEDWKGLSLQ